MNLKHLFVNFLAGILGVIMFACNNADITHGDEGKDANEQSKSLQTGEVRIKACPDTDNKISFLVTSERISIDWGDETTEDFTPNGVLKKRRS
jgi:hypothetical protein